MTAERRSLVLLTCALILAFMVQPVRLTGRQQRPPGSPPAYDVILRHGTVIDGTGAPRYQADVGIIGHTIAAVGDLSQARARLDLDVTGLFVVPGFINLHSHASPDAVATAANMLVQGVTTEIINADGGGGTDLTEQLAAFSSHGLAENLGAYVGFNSVWTDIVGREDRRAKPDEIARMRALITANLEKGAWGVSAGLDYKPAYYATADEVIAVVSAASKWRTNFPNHERLTPEAGFSSRVGIAETIRIGEWAGLVPVITHMKIQGHEQGTAARVIGMMRQATARGHYTAADQYPYLAGQTGLGALLVPGWAQAGGRDALLARLKNPADRARIVAAIETAMNARFGGPSGVYLPETQRHLPDIMKEMHASAGETVARLIEERSRSAILSFGSEPDVVAIMQNPVTAIACDCGATLETRVHPRFYGTFPRVLGHYVRETHALTWEDAIRRMTGLPASTIGLVDRGLLAPGMAADVTVFDPKTVIDHSTYEDPARLPEGIRDVFVNGVAALRDGRPTGKRGGAVLTRTEHMPTRPMSTSGMRRVGLSRESTLTLGAGADAGAGAGVGAGADARPAARIIFNIRQARGARHATGSLRVTMAGDAQAAASPREIEMVDWGVLQEHGKWASVTGRARVDGGAEQSVRLIVDGADPLSPPQTVTLILDLADGSHLEGVLPAGRVAFSSS